jgi:2-polyprenyl-6-hydroxyphenyl methylase/3-demethylubiquinone-9 3-methyltransferase
MISQFDFGSNWAEFSKQHIDRQRLVLACESLQSLLEEKSLSGRSFLDVGCGSGLFSIAAHQLGATKVIGIDVNPRCIEISQANRDFLVPGAPIEFYVASALDPERLKSFGNFNLVYAWGSLHHTGSMWNALRNVSECVGPEGILVLAIYNKHVTSPVWKSIKWFYNRAPGIIQRCMVAFFGVVIYVAKFLVIRTNPMQKERGMDFWFDVVDWIGGYPYEYARREEVEQSVYEQGFLLDRFIVAQVPTGCNEFVFSRVPIRHGQPARTTAK